MSSSTYIKVTALIAVLGMVGCDKIPSLSQVLEGAGSAEPVVETIQINDPLYIDQWHLKNTGQEGGTVGEDINVESVWNSYLGTGVRIAVVDDGLEIAHEDLAANVVANASYDYLELDNDPTGGSHGTAVGGVAAAVGNNNMGVRGVAPSAELVGYNFLQYGTSANEQDAMTRGLSTNSIYSNSWGAADGTGKMYASSATWRSAVDEGVATGRAGKGAIYTWAAGNGGTIEDFGGGILFPFDNSNNDGQANYYAVLAIAALADDGSRASYSEEGANLMVAAPAGEFCDTHTTTTVDRSGANGYNTGGDFVGNGKSDYADANYTKCFNGTSSATPVATGAIALMLEANPNLSWRDVRIILARSARKNDATDTDWTTNGAGLNVNHKYGYGALDTAAAVTMAKGWATVGGSNSMVTRSSTSSPAALIPDNGAGDIFQYGTPLSNTITLSNSGISNIEFVEITVDSDHTYSSDLEIEITSPNGTISKLAKTRRCNDGTSFVNCGAQYSGGWRFGSARHIDESADGTWTLTVTDGWYAASGYLNSWQLKIYGH